MPQDGIHRDMPVSDIMDRWPETVPVFIRLGLLCVGCTFGTFHSLDDACEAHDAELDDVMARLCAAITDR